MRTKVCELPGSDAFLIAWANVVMDGCIVGHHDDDHDHGNEYRQRVVRPRLNIVHPLQS